MPRLQTALFLLTLATASVPVTLAAQSTYGAVPGSLNFVQGQANIDGQPISTNSTASRPRQLHAGQTLATANGSADILLAPGALLRLGHDTTVRMITASAQRTEVRLDQGVANLSANVVRHDDLLLLDTAGGQTQVLSRGLYTLNAGTGTLHVFNGEAYVFPGADTSSNVKPVRVKEGHELTVSGDRAHPEKFDRELADEDLLPWTGPRESEAALADSTVIHNAGTGYGGYAGAYGLAPWSYGDSSLAYGEPYGYGYPWGSYGFGGYPFFGVGFGFGGYYGGGYYGGFGGHPIYPIHGPLHGPIRGGFVGQGGFSGGRGFAGGHSFGGGGFHGGGFHGGGHR